MFRIGDIVKFGDEMQYKVCSLLEGRSDIVTGVRLYKNTIGVIVDSQFVYQGTWNSDDCQLVSPRVYKSHWPTWF